MKKIAPIGLLALGGGGDKLPAYSEVDAGKALTVSELGGLEWKSAKLYRHLIHLTGNFTSTSPGYPAQSVDIALEIINKSNTPITSISALATAIGNGSGAYGRYISSNIYYFCNFMIVINDYPTFKGIALDGTNSHNISIKSGGTITDNISEI